MYSVKQYFSSLNFKDRTRLIIGLLSFLILCIWHLTYTPNYSIMDDIFNMFFTMFFTGYVFYSWSKETNRKEIKEFFLFLSTIRFGALLYLLGHLIFGYETVFGSPHLILIFITMAASVIISKKSLLLRYFNRENGKVNHN